MKDYFKYRYRNNIDFSVDSGCTLTILGNSSENFINNFLLYNKDCNIFIGESELLPTTIYDIYRNVGIVLFKNLNIFTSETVMDEIAFPLESLSYSKDDIRELIISKARLFKLNHLLSKDPYSLGSSDKAKLKILSAYIIKPKVLILYNVISELDYNDKILIFDILKEYTKNGGIVINVTSDVEDALFGDRIIIIHDDKLAIDGKTLSVLNEEKLLKRLGIGMPFMIELNKYFMDYGMINKYYLSNEKLVGALWK